MTRMLRTALAAGVVVLAACVTLRADDTSKAKKSQSPAELLAHGDQQTIDRILDTAVGNIARRYNLTDSQRKKTAEIMNREVHRFLSEHEDEVWPLVRDFLARGAWGSPPKKVEEMKRIGRTAGPLMKEIKEAIVRGNEEWRMYLSGPQKAMHDWDMQKIDETFDKVDENLQKWADGDPNAGGIFPPPPPPNAGPRMPPRPPEDELLKPKIFSIFEFDTVFDAFADRFIKQYHLDQSQRDAARSILDEYKAMASDFRNSKKSELQAVGAKWLAAQQAGDRKALLEAEQERKELLKPVVHGMLGEMESRLTALLTTAQKDQYADKGERPTRSAQTVSQDATHPAEPTQPEVKPVTGSKKPADSESGNNEGQQDGR